MRLGNWRFLAGSVMIPLIADRCGKVARSATPDFPTPSLSFTPISTFTPPPSVFPVPIDTATAPTSAIGTFYAEATADNVNLRTQPGTVFPVRLLLAKGTHLQILGHAPGGEWLYVQTDSEITGWVLYWLVRGGHDGGATPLVEPQNVQLIKGRIVDRTGMPVISGIGFAVAQGTGPNAPRTDATSDSKGEFYAYLPASANGLWYVPMYRWHAEATPWTPTVIVLEHVDKLPQQA